MSITCTRVLEWDMGHRLVGHEGKCRHLHGHRYKAEVTCSAQDLDSVGRVIDFSVIKGVVGKWIDEYWDHKCMLNAEDRLVRVLPAADIVPVRYNPTAENIAADLFARASVQLHYHNIIFTQIKLWETPNCFVVCTGAE